MRNKTDHEIISKYHNALCHFPFYNRKIDVSADQETNYKNVSEIIKLILENNDKYKKFPLLISFLFSKLKDCGFDVEYYTVTTYKRYEFEYFVKYILDYKKLYGD